MPGGYEIVLWALLVVASITDLVWGKVFNAITMPAMAAGLIVRLISEGSRSAGDGLTACAAAFVIFYPLWRLKTFSAGDVKLLMAVGAWSSYKLVIEMGLIAILVGAAAGLFVLVRSEGLLGSAKSLADHLRRRLEKKSHRVPFAPAFLSAFLVLKVLEMKKWVLVW